MDEPTKRACLHALRVLMCLRLSVTEDPDNDIQKAAANLAAIYKGEALPYPEANEAEVNLHKHLVTKLIPDGDWLETVLDLLSGMLRLNVDPHEGIYLNRATVEGIEKRLRPMRDYRA